MTGERYIYALTGWTVEKRAKGWYFAKSANRHDGAGWHGPYRSEYSVAMMIARQLRACLKSPHRRQRPLFESDTHRWALAPATAQFAPKRTPLPGAGLIPARHDRVALTPRSAFARQDKRRPGQRVREFRRVGGVEHGHHRSAQRFGAADRRVFHQNGNGASRQLHRRL